MSIWPRGLRLSTAAAVMAGGLLVAATPDRAEAQFYPWGGWSNAQPWQQKKRPRRVRRAPRQYVEPTNEKPTAALPKPSGPLVIVVSLNRQTLTVYDDGKQIARSPISSGKSSNPTPTGVFSILEKKQRHFSNLYNGAPMPFMQRLTNSGIAFHAGELPGYPASHGCIRLPYSFARNLFEITEVGARVIVSNDDLTPVQFNSPDLINPLPAEVANDAAGNAMQTASAGGVSDLLITRANAATAAQTLTRGMAASFRAAERDRLANSVTEAENARVAAEEQVAAATKAVKDAREAIKAARAEDARLAKAVRTTAATAAKETRSFKALTARLAKIDPSKLDAEALEKQSAYELAEEKKMVDAVEAAAATKKAAAEQAARTKQAIADAAALEKARKIAVDDVKHAETVVADARKALAAADALEQRKDMPVSVFISGKTGRLTAKLGFVEVINAPITIADEDQPLGTHVLTATHFTDGDRNLRWNAVTMGPNSSTPVYSSRKKRRHLDEEYVRSPGYNTDPAHALERIQIPPDVSIKLAELMKPGSSFIISDFPLSRETSERTEFVVEPWRSRPDSSYYRYY